MDVEVLLVAGLVIVCVAIGARSLGRGSWAEVIQRVAGTLGLHVTGGGLLGTGGADGTVDRWPVKVERFTRRRGNTSTTFTRVTVGAALPASLSLRSEGFGFGRIFAGGDIEVGDPAFDNAALLRGDNEADIVSRLSAPTRAAILAALRSFGLTIEAGDLVSTLRGGVREPDGLIERARALVAIADALHPSATVSRRLLNGLEGDPSVGYRRRCFELLMQTPQGPMARAALDRALVDPDPHLRVAAARRVEPDRAEPALRAIFDDLRMTTPLRAEALAGLAAVGRPPGLDALQAIVATAATVARASSDLARAAAAALAAHGSAGEPLLITLLEGRDDDVDLAAAQALAEVGTLAAVEPLLAHTRGLLRPRAVKTAAQTAVARIQERHGGTSGQLSLTDEGAPGQLSLAPAADPGQLALAPEASGQGDADPRS